MKKFGFTLAEVLITLTIIGVVSALALPSFIAGVQKQKIGPKLAKAVSVFEQATQAVLDDAQSDSISGAMVECSGATGLKNWISYEDGEKCFMEHLSHHLKGSLNDAKITGSDNISYNIAEDDDGFITPILFPSGTATIYPHDNKVLNKLTVDINAATDGGDDGYEVFYFYMLDDGSLVPYGSSRDAAANRWTATCRKGEAPLSTNAQFCAGHVLENNLKVEYK